MDHMERRKKIQTCAIAALAFGAGCNLRTQLNFFPFGPCDPNNHSYSWKLKRKLFSVALRLMSIILQRM